MTHALLTGFLGAFAFFLQLTLGALGILAIAEITGGRWAKLIRPILLSVLPNFYLLGFLFFAFSFVGRNFYPVALHPKLYSQVFFSLRIAFDFAAWIIISRGLKSRLVQGKSARVWAGGSLLVLLFTISFASMDWFMTLIPDWTSTGYGVVYISGCLGGAFAFATLIALRIRRAHCLEVPKETKTPLLNDLGNLVLMSVLLWAYVSYMQFLIIWSGQLPSETKVYDLFSENHWLTCVLLTASFCFAIPFASLLFRSLKANPKKMATLLSLFLVGRWLDQLLWTAPAQGLDFAKAAVFGLAFVLLLGAAWFAVFFRTLRNVRERSF